MGTFSTVVVYNSTASNKQRTHSFVNSNLPVAFDNNVH